jgi:hypothetical protein
MLRVTVGVAGGISELVMVVWIAVVSMLVVLGREVAVANEAVVGVVETALGLLLRLGLISVVVAEILELFGSDVIVGKKAGAVTEMPVGVSLQAAKTTDSSKPIIISRVLISFF